MRSETRDEITNFQKKLIGLRQTSIGSDERMPLLLKGAADVDVKVESCRKSSHNIERQILVMPSRLFEVDTKILATQLTLEAIPNHNCEEPG